jgi:hypothetical protein
MNRRHILKYLGLGAASAAFSNEDTRAYNAGFFEQGNPGFSGAAFNQVGYLPAGEKIATVKAQDGRDGENASFQVVPEGAADAQPVFRGELPTATTDSA